MNDPLLQKVLEDIEARIMAYHTAIMALVSGGVQSFSLDTGQTTESVTRFDLPRLEDAQAALIARRADLQLRLYGGGAVQVVPWC